MSFEYPFIFLGSFGVGVKYLLIIFYCILGAMIFTYLFNLKTYEIKFTPSKSITVKVFITYTLLIPFCWWTNLTNYHNNILTDTFNWILSVEFIFAVILVIAVGYGIAIYSNKDTYFNALIIPVTVILYLDILSTIITRQVDFLKWYNIMLFISLGLFIWAINNIRFERVNKSENNIETNKPNFLFKQRIWQAKALERLINEHPSSEPLSICISGEWGKGKTSFVKAVMNNIIKEKKRHHKIIWINTMDMDSVESLFEYLFQRIKNELKNKGYYVGISSEYQNYISSVLEIISKAKISNAIKNLFGKEKDYRDTKKYLEEMLFTMLGKDKLIIIVDNIERCDSSQIAPFINFIKEIATFKNCIIIFLTDYEQLKCKLNKPIKYLDKFFNQRINLQTVNFQDILENYLSNTVYEFGLYNEIKISVLSEIQIIISKVNKIILKLEEDNNQYNKATVANAIEIGEKTQIENEMKRIELLKKRISFLEDNLNNPRNIVKLLIYIQEYCLLLKDKFSSTDPVIIYKYLDKIQAQKNIIIISLIRTIFQEKYEMIQELSLNSYVDYLCDVNSVKDSDDEFINCLVSGLWHKTSLYTRTNGYQQNEIIKFITSLLKNPPDLSNIVHGFASFDEKYISMLKNNEEIDISLIEIFVIVVRNFSYQNYENGYELIEKLFSKISIQIKSNQIKNDIIFSFFSSGVQRQFAPKLHIMELIYKFFFSGDIIFNNDLSNQLKQLNLFCRNYVPETLENFSKTLYFHFIDKGREFDIVQSARERAMQGESFDDILNLFCDEMNDHFKSNKKIIHFDKIKSYLNTCKKELLDMGLMEMEDIKIEVEEAFAQVEEYKYLDKILIFINERLTEKVQLKDINFNNMQNLIDTYISELGNKTSIKTVTNETMLDLFNVVKKLSADNVFSKELINNFHNLITVFRNSFKDYNQVDVFYYRKVLADIQKKKEQSER